MYDSILKWWNRTWSNWEFDREMKVYGSGGSKYPIEIYDLYKRTSNDGLVGYKKIYK